MSKLSTANIEVYIFGNYKNKYKEQINIKNLTYLFGNFSLKNRKIRLSILTVLDVIRSLKTIIYNHFHC